MIVQNTSSPNRALLCRIRIPCQRHSAAGPMRKIRETADHGEQLWGRITVPALGDLYRLPFPEEDPFHPFQFSRLIPCVIAPTAPDRRRRSLECAGHASAFPFGGSQCKHSTLNFHPSTFNIRGGQVGACAVGCVIWRPTLNLRTVSVSFLSPCIVLKGIGRGRSPPRAR